MKNNFLELKNKALATVGIQQLLRDLSDSLC